jgi:energy-coupling factor transport system substrate-specific component
MTWQLASFLLLALALAGGFAWYERSQPSARVLALVGTLAALAVLGRIAFAPIPNVKPTSDLVLLSGYVFGGAPGFAVGAVAALASNFFFAQGPWTPWQMAAWGGIGVAGAGLARTSGGRLGRVPLALACGLAGLGYGVVLNFGSVVTLGGGALGERFLAYQATSLPWDLAHAAGNVAFFLLFGPGLVRTLRRFRTRLTFTWHPAAPPTAAALALAAMLALGTAARPPVARAAEPAATARAAAAPRAVVRVAAEPRALARAAIAQPAPARAAAPSVRAPLAYLLRAQNADGGFGAAPGRPSATLYTGWVALGLAAAGRNPATVRRDGRSPIDYVLAHARNLTRNGSATGVGDLERTILVLRCAARSARAVRGQDLVAALARRVGRGGSVLHQANLTAFAILALRAAGVPRGSAVVRRAAGWLAAQQNADGGFGFLARGYPSDVDDTAAIAQALVAAAGRSAVTARAAAFLRAAQNRDGGMGQEPGAASNAQSTGWAIEGLVAAGVRPGGLHRGGARSPVAYLDSLVQPDGAVRYARTTVQSPVWVTGSALLGLRERPLPLSAR